MLVATQAIGRPLGLALDFLVAVVAAEEMPRNSRAYAVSVLAMASGLGAGIAVMALPLADIGESAWRFIYVVTLIWLVVAVDIARRLPETTRFAVHTRSHRRSTGAGSARSHSWRCLRQLLRRTGELLPEQLPRRDARLLRRQISWFTLSTATPAGIGLIIGGRIADVRGRRHVLAVPSRLATALVVVSFVVERGADVVLGVRRRLHRRHRLPGLAVYRAELFPTGNRGRAAGLLTAGRCSAGSVGLAARRSVCSTPAGRTAG